MRTSPFKMKTVTRKSKRATVHRGVGSTSELVTVAEPTIPRGPWILGFPLYVAGLFLRRVWLPGGVEQALFSLLFLAAGAGIGMFGWFYAKARSRFQRWHATLTPVGFSVIMIVPLCFGWGRYSSLIVLTYWIVLTGGWVARVARSVWGDGADMHHATGDEGEVHAALGLDGVRVSRVERHGTPGERPVRITSRWTMRGAEGYEQLAKAKDRIRNYAKARSVRVRPVPTDPQAADVTVVKQDVLKDPKPWPGPSLPHGASIWEPLRVGIRQDGQPELVWFVTDQGTVRCLVVGCAGTGKSRLLWDVIADGAGRCDVVWWIADIAKAGQTVAPARDLFDWIAPDLAKTKALLDSVAEIGKARSQALGDDQTWHPRCGFPLLFVIVEEGAGVTSKLTEQITRLAERVRSVGIVLYLSMQRPSGRNMPTDARAQFTSTFCFGTDDKYTADMALNPATIAAGANPGLLADTAPGVHWHEGPGVDRADWSEPCRTYLIDAPTLRRVVAETAPYRTRLDELSARAAGPAYAARHLSHSTTAAATPQDTPQDMCQEEEQPTRPLLSQAQQVEAARAIVDKLDSGVVSTATLLLRWADETGMDRRSMYRALEACGGIRRGEEKGTWIVSRGRPDEDAA